MCQVLFLGISKTEAYPLDRFKPESLIGGIGSIIDILDWEANSALAVSKDY